jgi:protein-tyrosine phosphatase
MPDTDLGSLEMEHRVDAQTALANLPEELRTALLAAAPNFREAGGLATSDGRTLRTGVVYRTGQLAGLPPLAEQALTALNVVDVYDLRTDAERDPRPDTLPEHIALVVANVLADDPGSGATAVAALSNAGGGPPSAQAINDALGGGKSRAMMLETYQDFVRLSSAQAAYRSFVTGVAASTGAVAVHCTAGKDRTGWAAALLQLSAGVDEATVVEQYLASNGPIKTQFGPLLAQAAAAGVDAGALEALVYVEADYLDAASSLMTTTYGGIEGYLEKGLGLRSSEIDALHARLLD